MYNVLFEWDEQKAESNERKHGVTFIEAATCFLDPHQIAFYDPEHSDDEDRELLIAHSRDGRLLVVSHTMRGEVIRLISARPATRMEAADYAKGI